MAGRNKGKNNQALVVSQSFFSRTANTLKKSLIMVMAAPYCGDAFLPQLQGVDGKINEAINLLEAGNWGEG